MRKSKIEIIDETVEFYSKNPRAMNKNLAGNYTCVYLSESGSQCAHSRCLTDEALKLVVVDCNISTANMVIFIHGDNIHLPEYRGHEDVFWVDIQSIHDTNMYWDGLTLTEDGKEFIEKLKIKWKDK